MPFSFPLLSVGGGGGGKKVRFESEEFNDRFTVRTDNPKFASDVIHPRTMEFLMAVQPPGFRIEGNLMRFSVERARHAADRLLCRLRTRVLQPACPRSSGRTSRSLRQRFAECRGCSIVYVR